MASGEVDAEEFDVVVEGESDLDVVRPDIAEPMAALTLLHLGDDMVADNVKTLGPSEGFDKCLLGKVVQLQREIVIAGNLQ